MTNNIILGVLGAQEIIFIALIILIFFGGKKIPELMRGLGKGVREYNKTVNNIKDQFNDINNDVVSSGTKTKENNPDEKTEKDDTGDIKS
ncbi:MAG: twin-arginine translocase TatA/TatE family subunit [Bacteroidales bacterium]|jgi:sec-independent protein translocase protein TatA|nr:twin-arginine translocase TatA/TatE family subunit [Bacteroidales bacterium]